jgi:hypothetical protein
VGKENGLKIVVLLQFIVVFLAYIHGRLMESSEPARKKTRWIAAPALAVLVVFLVSSYPSWNRNILSRGWYRNFQDIEADLERTSWMEALRLGPALLAQQQESLVPNLRIPGCQDSPIFTPSIFSGWSEAALMKTAYSANGSNLMKLIVGYLCSHGKNIQRGVS